MRFNAVTKLVLVLGGLLVANGAQAVPLDGTALTITSGGVSATFTATNCSNSGGSCLDFEMIQDGASFGVTIQPTTGANLASNPPGNDVSFDLNLISSGEPITGIYASIVGFGDGSSAGMVLPGLGLTAYPNQPTESLLAPSTSFTVSFDVGADAFTPGTYVTSVTTDFGVPEPASLALLGAGFGLTALLRRRRCS